MEKTPNPETSMKISWYWGLVYPLVWFALFYAAVIPSFYYFPDVLTKESENLHKNEFIGERAEETLRELTDIGVKPVGSQQHKKATEYLYRKVETIRKSCLLDIYDIEIDKQIVSGSFNSGGNFKMYKNIVNIVIKVRPKNVKNENALLINSHYDSEVGSYGAGDAGVMIAIMIEIYRVMICNSNPFTHTVIFLLNSSEENGLLASHGFITSHKWAKFVKAVINLDSAGNGGKEILFQSGPNHPWLMKYYKQNVPLPFASTMAEELFQHNLIPSDTDFRIFRDFGKVPGLDLAHSHNGYVYHTKYDRFNILPRGTYQLTGNNILALTKSLANAPELDDIEAHESGHAVFFDVLGWFMIYYTETEGIIINALVSVISVASTVFFLYSKMKKNNHKPILRSFFFIFLTQLISVIIAVFLNYFIAFVMDSFGRSLSYYTGKWILFGLYFCPVFFVLGIGQSLLMSFSSMNDQNTSLKVKIQMIMHSYSIILIIILVILMIAGIRSSFLIMISVLFFTVSVVINFFIDWFYKNDILWCLPHCLCQLLPFWFYTYLCYVILEAFIPMAGRSGTSNNPDNIISLFIAFFSLLIAGFLIPLLNFCKRTKLIVSMFGILTIIFIIIATTQISFPFRAETSPQRYSVSHINRKFLNYKSKVKYEDSGYCMSPSDRRYSEVERYVRDFNKRLNFEEECKSKIFCGIPISKRTHYAASSFIPGPKAKLPEKLSVKLLKKEFVGSRRKFEIEISGSDHTTIIVDFRNGTKLVNWNLNSTLDVKNLQPPITIRSFYEPLDDLEKTSFLLSLEFEAAASQNSSTFDLVIASFYVHDEAGYSKDFKDFMKSFANWTVLTHKLVDYQSFEM